MKKSDRTAAEDEAPARRHDAELDTGHPAWVKMVALVVILFFVLATIVAALV